MSDKDLPEPDYDEREIRKLQHVYDLTEMQAKFVIAYIGPARLIGTDAARMAGYSHPLSSSRDNLMSDSVREAIDEILEANTMTKSEVLAELAYIAKANPEENANVTATAKHSALKSLQKAHGLHRETIEVTGEGGGPVEHTFADLDDEELEAKIAALEAKENDEDEE